MCVTMKGKGDFENWGFRTLGCTCLGAQGGQCSGHLPKQQDGLGLRIELEVKEAEWAGWQLRQDIRWSSPLNNEPQERQGP